MGNLLRLLGRRLISLPFVAFGVVFLVFFLMSFSQYDPAVSALGENATAEQLAAYRHEMGFDRSWGEQFLSYLGGLFQGNLGVYGVNKDSVSSRIATAFPITLQLTFIALIIAVVFSVIFGVLAALYRDTWVDQVIRVISIIAIATPSFWLGVLLIYLLQIKLALLPGAGELVPFSVDPGEYLARMAMPAFSLGFPVAGQMTRIIRTSMVEELDKDYVRTAIGAGVPKRVVIARNVFRNALITPVTVLGMKIGYLMGGAIITEGIFNINGVGGTLWQAIRLGEAPTVVSITTVLVLVYILANLVVDLLYAVLDPRIRYE